MGRGDGGMRYLKEALVGLVALLALALVLAGVPGLTALQAQTLAAVLVTLSLWGTALVPGYAASLLFLTVVIIAGLAAPAEAFSGFSSQAMWLVISGFTIGEAIRSVGLGTRLAEGLGPRLSHSYPALLGGLMGLCIVLSFLMPSSVGRAVVMVPVGMALADRLGFGRGSNGRIGIALIIAFGTHMPGFGVLPGNIPNLVLAGAAERLYDVRLAYASYLALHFPVLGLVKAPVIVWLVLRFFPARIEPGATPELDTSVRSDPARQRWLVLLLVATLGLWLTDTLHGISPAWIGMAASCIILMPRIGFLDGPAFKQAMDFGTLLFIAGALSLGVVVTESGLGPVMAHWLTGILPLAQGHDFANFASLVGLGAVTGIFTTIPGVPAVLTVLAGELSELTGLPLDAVIMTQVIGFSTVFFPYQAPPLLVAMGLSGESVKPLLKILLALAAVSLLVLTPLAFFWWQLLGWI
ncbi:Di- and tricarboxylate transporter [Pseudooceanicola antarcticus]|uniref:Di- and tricarboxylate transporter n=2 Tax=Pseudooceanicola antarcticus TaxID=1247613 RepID=A0A285IQT5_9RHOB|nr:Di- and tricarboxylate transporter [Pseudooceanicola antarcticus]